MATGIIDQALDYLADITCYGYASNPTSSMALTTTKKKVALADFQGRDCSLSANGIKVNNGGVYEVSGTVYFTDGYNAQDVVHALLYRNDTMIAEFAKRVYSGSPYENMSISPAIVSLDAGDVIYLYAYNQSAARGSTGTGATRNYLKLRRIA